MPDERRSSSRDVSAIFVPADPLKSKYVFLSTDYDNYAGVFHCQHLAKIVHRRNVYVLSRTPQIDELFVEKVRAIGLPDSILDLGLTDLCTVHV